MKEILVSGMINVETSVFVRQFPIEYAPIDFQFNGIDASVSGVGYNVAKALKTLGAEPRLCSLIGNSDMYGDIIESEVNALDIQTDAILKQINNTPCSVVMFDSEGKRKIILDLKDIQENLYPEEIFVRVLKPCDIAVLCNINFSRGLLRIAKDQGKLIATDVHVVSSIEDDFNRDFMAAADILFLSNEYIQGRESAFLRELGKAFGCAIIVVGMGERGALLYSRSDDKQVLYSSVRVREIQSTVGAGDALFSAFLYFYNKDKNPYTAMENAIVFASYKIGEKGGGRGFLTERALLEIKENTPVEKTVYN
ncbi:carbohydrate kinase family protein [Brucepastera parasyntrophica]|uniref:carbohydrate kinase family protein n=1 Tax=Brucepastera parasyntrophica TaxID=2880008 RepID=UPI00210A4F8C|nr:carbohydrate kinase family protein [Brucepastera parasyntrophica]ULQ59535.1 carbohydrate kinase family protein [Brucepastera parasyntrophica]